LRRAAAYEKAAEQIGRANIAVVGNTGVGKSTLINAMFGFDIAKTGVGRRVTEEIAYYEHPSGAVGFFDTRGIEVGEAKAQVIEGFRSLVAERHSRPQSEQIHVAWYCLRAASARFVDADAEIVQALHDFGVPVIVVLTQVARREGGLHPVALELAHSIEARGLPLAPDGRAFFVMATSDEFEGHETHGLEDLLDATFRVAPEGVHRALIAGQIVDLERKEKASRKIVQGAAATAATAGAVPIPFSDAAALVPIQVGMFAGVTVTYGLAISKGTFVTLAGAALSYGGLTNAGKYLVTNLLMFVPGGNVAAVRSARASPALSPSPPAKRGSWSATSSRGWLPNGWRSSTRLRSETCSCRPSRDALSDFRPMPANSYAISAYFKPQPNRTSTQVRACSQREASTKQGSDSVVMLRQRH
jgi:uncharacterized protein (DUF697 family)/GTP-binding protein EngB required for normal cell division